MLANRHGIRPMRPTCAAVFDPGERARSGLISSAEGWLIIGCAHHPNLLYEEISIVSHEFPDHSAHQGDQQWTEILRWADVYPGPGSPNGEGNLQISGEKKKKKKIRGIPKTHVLHVWLSGHWSQASTKHDQPLPPPGAGLEACSVPAQEG